MKRVSVVKEKAVEPGGDFNSLERRRNAGNKVMVRMTEFCRDHLGRGIIN